MEKEGVCVRMTMAKDSLTNQKENRQTSRRTFSSHVTVHRCANKHKLINIILIYYFYFNII